MHLRKRSYTFIIASHADARLWRWSLPYPVLLGLVFFVGVGIITSVAASFRIGRMILTVEDRRNILSENDSFRVENRTFRIRTAELGEKVDLLESMAHKLWAICGMNEPSRLGGAGGISAEICSSQTPPDSVGTLLAMDRYSKSASTLEDRFRTLGEYISRRTLLGSAMPDRMPVKGYVSALMGPREDPIDGSVISYHKGLDITAPYGAPVRAPADGVVICAGRRPDYGNFIEIDHMFGFVTRYGHLSRMNVKLGDRVCRSDIIGYVGSSGRATGPHLHYEVWQHSVRKDPRLFFAHSETE